MRKIPYSLWGKVDTRMSFSPTQEPRHCNVWVHFTLEDDQFSYRPVRQYLQGVTLLRRLVSCI
ncbi:MAG TPA: hypothetical protein VKU19_36225 [Bryobacteraceae bacterium]|nr:hypothetical protein [Bryobacteraceae bacterium]